jgi:hypothetical protein
MAYASSGLTRMAGGGGYNVWMYASADAIADVNTEGYFNAASTMVNVGDVILRLVSLTFQTALLLVSLTLTKGLRGVLYPSLTYHGNN